jgi:hypothetical protein
MSKRENGHVCGNHIEIRGRHFKPRRDRMTLDPRRFDSMKIIVVKINMDDVFVGFYPFSPKRFFVKDMFITN